ncbi:response regulator [Candidatus Amarolinea aalborgensis]|jgi:DNA-binding NarL/FixJ family response regulator|uniref:response regulator n=1 Tax=Candidatus Amarolinea aalborgensis TaxID=2249329 RepID=UPI003BF9E882
MTSSAPLRVLLADDHAVVRKGIREFLEEDGEIRVVAEATDGADAVRLAGEHQPHVAVLDVQMPVMNGIEATRQIKAAYPDVRVLILTAYDDDPYVFALLRAGADGYVLKNTDPDDLVRAVKAIAAGGKVLAPDIAAKVVAQVTSGKPAAAQEQVEALTDREVAVLRLAALGWTNKAIAAELVISDRTVQGHLANIYSKIGVTTRTEAVTKALKLGWLVLDAR